MAQNGNGYMKEVKNKIKGEMKNRCYLFINWIINNFNVFFLFIDVTFKFFSWAGVIRTKSYIFFYVCKSKSLKNC